MIAADNIVNKFSEWQRNPRLFVIEALKLYDKGYYITSQQEQALEELRLLVTSKLKAGWAPHNMTKEDREYSKKMGISIMSGKGTGKDAFASWIILWYLTCFERCKIPCTANTSKQLKDVLWAEINKWLKGSILDKAVNGHKDYVTWQAEKIYTTDSGGRDWYATPRTVNVKAAPDQQKETLQGFHEDFTLFVIDEASGIPYAVFEPFETTLTGLCNIVLMIFNPTRAKGYAIDSQYKDKGDWISLHWNAEDCELIKDTEAGRAQLERLKNKYGEDSNAYRVSVKGLPPTEDEGALIPYEWVQDAVDREIIPKDTEPLIFGVDVGMGGDKSIILHRRGGKVEKISSSSLSKTGEICDWIAREALNYEARAIYVDVIGVGKGVYDGLVRDYTFPNKTAIRSVCVSNSSRRKERFSRLRDELWWKVRTLFEKNLISIPPDQELIDELTSISYNTADKGGIIKIQNKKDLKKKSGIDSPNKADALCLSLEANDAAFMLDFNDRYDTNETNNHYQNNSNSFMGG